MTLHGLPEGGLHLFQAIPYVRGVGQQQLDVRILVCLLLEFSKDGKQVCVLPRACSVKSQLFDSFPTVLLCYYEGDLPCARFR